MKKYGLFIGVNKYNRVTPGLKGAEADAKLLSGLFTERLGFDTVVLTDEHLGYGDSGGSLDRIMEQLEKFKEKLHADGGGVLVLYFAGHGVTTDKGEQFLLGPKAPEYALSRPAAGDMGVISEASLRKATDDWPGVKRAFIFDACRTNENRLPMVEGAIGGRLGMAVARKEGDDLQEDLVILRSCPSDQIACELTNYGEGEDKKDHGLFSAALWEIVRRQADDESPFHLDAELSQTLAQEMHRLARKYMNKGTALEIKERALAQHPEFHGGRLCLIDKSDYRQIRIRGLLDKFGQQLAAGNLSDPPGESCRDILNQLAAFNLDQAALRNFSAQLQAAEKRHVDAAIFHRDEQLIKEARKRGSLAAYRYTLSHLSPESTYREEAGCFIDEAEAHAEEADWSDAQVQKSRAGYLRYLGSYPRGPHAEEAARVQAEQKGKEEEHKEKEEEALTVIALQDNEALALDSLSVLLARAESGNVKAQNDLAGMYHYGRGVPQDYDESVKWLRKAADQGNVDAQYDIGSSYRNGWGVPLDYLEAMEWYRKAAAQGFAMAQHSLGVMYSSGEGVPQDYDEAVKWFRKAADQGDVAGQFEMGWVFRNGKGVPQDYDEAFKWFRKGAEQSDADCQNALGLMYSSGIGVPRNDNEAAKWYRKAADQGYAPAQYNLGGMYDLGRGVPQDLGEAAKWHLKAAEQGAAVAQNIIGSMYHHGRGVPQDYVEAVKWYRKAADQGDYDAQCNMGFMYKHGLGVARDHEEEMNWMRKTEKSS